MSDVGKTFLVLTDVDVFSAVVLSGKKVTIYET